MKLLFLDDCYRKDKNYLGYGGFCIDAQHINAFCNDILKIKEHFGIPPLTELKWSPDRKHFLNTQFKGKRQDLYRQLLDLLNKYNASILCAVHDLNECYPVKHHGWDINKAILWATSQQSKFISERFEEPYLKVHDDIGLIVADHYSNKKEEASLSTESFISTFYGGDYRKFKRICMNPLMAISTYFLPIQIADIVIGIVVCSLAGSIYAIEQFNSIGTLFVKNPYETITKFTTSLSDSSIGWGLKLFPRPFVVKGMELFEPIDAEYRYTEKGVIEADKAKIVIGGMPKRPSHNAAISK